MIPAVLVTKNASVSQPLLFRLVALHLYRRRQTLLSLSGNHLPTVFVYFDLLERSHLYLFDLAKDAV